MLYLTITVPETPYILVHCLEICLQWLRMEIQLSRTGARRVCTFYWNAASDKVTVKTIILLQQTAWGEFISVRCHEELGNPLHKGDVGNGPIEVLFIYFRDKSKRFSPFRSSCVKHAWRVFFSFKLVMPEGTNWKSLGRMWNFENDTLYTFLLFLFR